MRCYDTRTRRGFSLIELVIVVVIMGIIAAIAVPRLSRGSAGAADSALAGDLAVLRNAIDLYATEHSGTFPAADKIVLQLTGYSTATGDAVEVKDRTALQASTHIFGPYLRRMPVLPVGPEKYKGAATVIDGSSGTPGTAEGGWFYNPKTGEIRANLADAVQDASGKAYNTY